MIARHAALLTAALVATSTGEALADAMKTSDAPYVATYLVKKKDGMSFDAFKAYQLDTHVPLALSLPGLIDYRLTFFPPYGGDDQPVDAIAEVTFGNQHAYEAAMASEAGQRALADLPNMLDLTAVIVLTAKTGDIYVARIAQD
ncbi:MAG: EthD family reductase [Minwuia sp.]|uniref:EthD family reductase n=1 Tax=Minwuia sp. TaxID=2493630 RepID=UPI003A83A61D